MTVIWVNYPVETFTPTGSGALATIIWECCREAAREGATPTVITRASSAPTFPWPQTVCVDYPNVPSNRWIRKAYGLHRNLTGWSQLRHKAYAIRVAAAIRKLDRPEAPLILLNDPAMTVYFRSVFPDRHIVHWFENQQSAPSAHVRSAYASSANVTLGVSDFTSRWISDHYCVPVVKTLYNGVDLEQFAPGAARPEGSPVINFVGRTGMEKAPDLLLKAALALTKQTHEFRLQLIGSNHWDHFELDDYQRELNDLVRELTDRGIEVRRPGHVGRADLPGQFRQAHIHVVPSRWDEPFGLTTVEGMASGLATVASNTGGTPEVVGDAGILFERDNVEGLRHCLHLLVTSVERREDYALRARLRAEQFSWRRTWTEMKFHAGV